MKFDKETSVGAAVGLAVGVFVASVVANLACSKVNPPDWVKRADDPVAGSQK